MNLEGNSGTQCVRSAKVGVWTLTQGCGGLFKGHLRLMSDAICLMLPDNSDSSMEGRQRAKTAVRKLLQSTQDVMECFYHGRGSACKKEGMPIRPFIYQVLPNLPRILQQILFLPAVSLKPQLIFLYVLAFLAHSFIPSILNQKYLSLVMIGVQEMSKGTCTHLSPSCSVSEIEAYSL